MSVVQSRRYCSRDRADTRMPHLTLFRTLLVGSIVTASAAFATEPVEPMKLRIVIGDTTLMATLADNPTTRDFVSLLPMSVELKDHAQTEKVSDLPRKLSTADAPAGSDPEVGDIAYYAPWGNLALFHKDFSYSKGLIKLGRIDSGVETLRRPGPVAARIELVSE